MNETLSQNIRRVLNETLIKRLLTKYFASKGVKKDMFEDKIYPPMLQDITDKIPQLLGKVEIQPFVEDLNPSTGKVTIGWNLFVLGNQRLDLGRSTHKNSSEIMLSVNGPMNRYVVKKFATPNRILEFVSRVLGKSEFGFIEQKPEKDVNSAPGQTGPGGSSAFYGGSQGFEQNRPVL